MSSVESGCRTAPREVSVALASVRWAAGRTAAPGHEFFDVAETQVAAKVQPDHIGDDLGWVAMSAVERGRAESTRAS